MSASLPTTVTIPRALRAASITGIRVAGMKESQEETRIRNKVSCSLLCHIYCLVSSRSRSSGGGRRTFSFLSPRSPPRRSNMSSRTVSSSPHPAVTTPAVHLSKEHLLENLLAVLSSGRFHTSWWSFVFLPSSRLTIVESVSSSKLSTTSVLSSTSTLVVPTAVPIALSVARGALFSRDDLTQIGTKAVVGSSTVLGFKKCGPSNHSINSLLIVKPFGLLKDVFVVHRKNNREAGCFPFLRSWAKQKRVYSGWESNPRPQLC